MAGLDSLRPEDALTGPQFSLHPESQLSGDHRFAKRFFPWRKGRCRRGDTQPLDAGWQLSLLLLVIFVADAAFSVWRMITAAGCELVRLAAKAGVVPAEHV
jgi:hypothetical protein